MYILCKIIYIFSIINLKFSAISLWPKDLYMLVEGKYPELDSIHIQQYSGPTQGSRTLIQDFTPTKQPLPPGDVLVLSFLGAMN